MLVLILYETLDQGQIRSIKQMRFTDAQLNQILELDGRVELDHFNPFTNPV